jgi:hypothetical protein
MTSYFKPGDLIRIKPPYGFGNRCTHMDGPILLLKKDLVVGWNVWEIWVLKRTKKETLQFIDPSKYFEKWDDQK